MRRHAFPIIVALLCGLLLVGTALAQSGGGHAPSVLYTVQHGVASGGSYHLTGLAWQVEGSAAGGGYRLLGPVSPMLRGNGCCCTYLPCVLRRFP